jgi:hypothetical protein
VSVNNDVEGSKMLISNYTKTTLRDSFLIIPLATTLTSSGKDIPSGHVLGVILSPMAASECD